MVGVNHALGITRGARSEKHGRDVRGVGFVDFFFEELWMLLGVYFTAGEQFVHRGQAGLVVLAQTAWVVVVDVAKLWALLADFEQLVDLLLVFHDGEAHFGVVERKHALSGNRILV